MSSNHPRRQVWKSQTSLCFQCSRLQQLRKTARENHATRRTSFPLSRIPHHAHAFRKSSTDRDCQPHGVMSRRTLPLACLFPREPCSTNRGSAVGPAARVSGLPQPVELLLHGRPPESAAGKVYRAWLWDACEYFSSANWMARPVRFSSGAHGAQSMFSSRFPTTCTAASHSVLGGAHGGG